MSYIHFDRYKTPFRPNVRQVIYFDVTGVSQKMFYHVFGDGYSRIRQLFRDAGLEFVFLPKVTEDMNIRKIYRYFKPDASEQEIQYFQFRLKDTDLLEFIDEDLKQVRIKPGLIQYMGRDWDEDGFYTFSYEPLPEEMAQIMYYEPEKGLELIIQDYIRRHSLSGMNDFSHDTVVREASSNKKEKESEKNASDLLSEAQQLIEKFKNAGIEGLALTQLIEKLSEKKPTLSRLRVKGNRFYLVDYKEEDGKTEMEVKMPALSRVIYNLYLNHPEGIAFRDLSKYRQELLGLYLLYTGREDQNEIESSIDDLINPGSNSISEKCSRIRQAFRSKMDDSIARQYYIDGKQGEVKKVALSQDLIIWE